MFGSTSVIRAFTENIGIKYKSQCMEPTPVLFSDTFLIPF